MNVLVTGASGMIGTATVAALRARGHRPIILKRSSAGSSTASATWDPGTGAIDLRAAEPVEAVIHLAGESIAQRWTPAARQRIRDSRVNGTRLLCDGLARLAHRPKVLIAASATGFYGDRGDELLDEASRPGSGFLPAVCQEWETAAAQACQLGIRVVHVRLGIVLARNGGALGAMLPAFRWGLGGRVGHGCQYWPWITLEDVLGIIQYCLDHDAISGPVNAVAPHPVTNREFSRTLAHALGRPCWLPAPAWALRLALGDMADEALLASARVVPGRLTQEGYNFQHPELAKALRHVLRRSE